MPVPQDNHLQEAASSGWSLIRGRSLQVIICKRPVHPDDHLWEAGPSRWSFARSRSIGMAICTKPLPPDDHLQEAGPSEWPIARGRSLDDHLEEAGSSYWSIAEGPSIRVISKRGEVQFCWAFNQCLWWIMPQPSSSHWGQVHCLETDDNLNALNNSSCWQLPKLLLQQSTSTSFAQKRIHKARYI